MLKLLTPTAPANKAPVTSRDYQREPLKATNQLADVFELNAPSTNQRASRLYSRSGFGCDREGARLRQACF